MAARLTAKLVGEGFARPNAESELPIDINYAKLGEWLVDRKQVPADFNRKLQAIQAKAGEAVQQLPPGFLGRFEGGDDAPLDYFLARQVLEQLAQGAEKGFLGGLKGEAGEWEKLVKAYEYNLIYVAEAAQTLSRNVDYEIPFLKKAAAKAQSTLADLERRKGEAHKSAAAAAADFQQECRQLGVDSCDIRGSLRGLTEELPPLVGAALEALQAAPITEALQYYAAVAGGDAGGTQAVLPVLAEVREGRTEPPAATEQAEAAATAGALEVEWDLGAALEGLGGGGSEAAATAGGGDAPTAGISWDLDAADLAAEAGDAEGGEACAGEAAPAGISWEVEVEATGTEDAPGAAAAAGDGGPTVDWGIDMGVGGEAAGAGGNAAAAAAEEEEAPAVVRRLVEDAAYRARLLDDLFELRAFLVQRCRELGGRSSELLLSGEGAEAEASRHVSSDQAGAWLAAVHAAVAALSGDQLMRLIALRSSPRYLERMVAGLQQKAGQEAKFKRAAADAESRRGEVQRQLMADSAKLAALLQRTRQAKEGAEAALSAKLGRRINIMGEVNTLLG